MVIGRILRQRVRVLKVREGTGVGDQASILGTCTNQMYILWINIEWGGKWRAVMGMMQRTERHTYDSIAFRPKKRFPAGNPSICLSNVSRA